MAKSAHFVCCLLSKGSCFEIVSFWCRSVLQFSEKNRVKNVVCACPKMCSVVFVHGQTPGSYGSGRSRHAVWHCSWLPHCDLWFSPQIILLLLLHHQTLHQKVCPTVNISNGNDDCCCVEDVLTVLQAQPGILSAWQQS